MKLAVFAILASGALAFTPPSMTFAVGKKPAKAAATKKVVKKAAPKPAPKKAAPKPAPKKAAPKKVVVKRAVTPRAKPTLTKVASASSIATVPSASIPGETAPAILDGSLIGDVGFDPCYLSTKADLTANYFNGLFNTNIDGLTWYREAELMHGRICQVAVLGFIVPGFGTLGSGDLTEAYSYTNPLEAWGNAPGAALFQIGAFMAALEFRRITNILEDGNNYMAGDAQRWGQGPGRWNPFGFDYTPEEYAEKQLQEVKHSRLAMIGLLGLVFQANASGVGVVDQLSAAFVYPDYVAKAGYFIPEGI